MRSGAGKQAHIVHILHSRIVRGIYKGELPSQRKLAQEFGTSVKTICVVLGRLEGHGMVRRTERQGTVVISRGEHARKTPALFARIALQTPIDDEGEWDPWASGIIYGFQRSAQEHHINTVLEYADADSVGGEVMKSVWEAKVPGCVGTCLVGVSVNVVQALWLTKASGPVILAESYVEEPVAPSIAFDHLDAGRQAAEHLVKLGHRQIAFVHREPISTHGGIRLKGAEEYLNHLGMKLTVRLGHRDGQLLGLERLFEMSDRPTAVILERARSVDLLLSMAATFGVRVPQDLSIVSFDDVRAFRYPPLTLVAMDHEALGRRALEALLDEDLWAHPRRILLPVKLVDRGTTSAPPCVAGFAEQGARPPTS